MGRKTFLFGAAVGAAAMYLLDPDSGDQRRSAAQTQARELADSPAAQKVAGQALEATRGLHDAGPDADKPLADKVRSEVLGRDQFADLVINLDAHDGTVTLRGVVDDPQQRQQLADAVRGVGGVTDVANLLHASGEPAPMG